MNDTIQTTMTNAANEAKAQFESFTKSFEQFASNDVAKKAAEQSAENLRATSESVNVVMNEMEQIGTGLVQHFAKTMSNVLETQARMLTAGGWQQAMTIQYEFMNQSMDAGFSELSRLTDRSTAMMTKAAAPLQSRFDTVIKAA